MQLNNFNIHEKELYVLLKDVYELYGYDFRDYSRPSILRRIENILNKEKMNSISELHFKLSYNASYFNTFLHDITVTFTEMFRDPLFFKSIREKVIPDLKHLNKIRIWHAGCSSGEEVYSMAILLQEEGLLHKTQLYATDINKNMLDTAKKANFNLKDFEKYEENYKDAGGKSKLTNYFKINDYKANINDDLKKKVIFSQHNLVVDQSFNEFHLIVCRNVLIYFNRDLQNNVIKLFQNSLPSLGYLALGTKETIAFSEFEWMFIKKQENDKIWQLAIKE